MDMVEVNTSLGNSDQQQITLDASFQLVLSALGRNNRKERENKTEIK